LQDCVFDACAQNDIELAVEQTIGAVIQACNVIGFDCPTPDTTPG